MRILLILLIAMPSLANGPKYNYKDPKLNDELQNVYKDLAVERQRPLDAVTLSQVKTSAPRRAGIPVYCSDCVTDAACISTGTAVGAYARYGARSTACQ